MRNILIYVSCSVRMSSLLNILMKSRKRIAAQLALLTALAGFSVAGSAFQPLITDDTGTQGSRRQPARVVLERGSHERGRQHRALAHLAHRLYAWLDRYTRCFCGAKPRPNSIEHPRGRRERRRQPFIRSQVAVLRNGKDQDRFRGKAGNFLPGQHQPRTRRAGQRQNLRQLDAYSHAGSSIRCHTRQCRRGP